LSQVPIYQSDKNEMGKFNKNLLIAKQSFRELLFITLKNIF